VTQYYELTYTNTKIGNASTSRIAINPNNGSLTAVTVYSNGKAIPAGSATPGTYTSVLFPATGVIKTEYIAKDAAGKETTLATYEEGGRQGYTYTISDSRVIKGYDLISSPSTTTGILGKTYNVGDVYSGGNLELSDQLQLARVYVATSEYGDAKVEVRVALKKDAAGNAITISSVNDPNIWKTILTTDSLAPGATASNGNYGGGASYYINGTDGIKYITHAGFTEDQLAGYKSHLTVVILANGLTQGQEPAKYYYAPQGQVRINYVTSNGKVIQAPVSAYENSGANTSYDVTGSTYQPQTITANGKTYRYVKSDKSLSKGGTTEVNGYTYNVTPSDATGTIKSATVNDVYYVYEQVTYHTEAEFKDVTRTIEYYDSVTGEPIPSNLESTVTQTAKLNRNKIYDDQNNFVGYGTISADGSSYTINDSWKVADQTWTEQKSADLSDYGYTAPDRASVAAVTVDGDTTNVTEKVYYGHQTVPVTPEKPGTPGKPINPNGDVDYPDGVSKDDLTATVKRTINYVDEDGNAVNGSPDGTSSYVQTAKFTRTAIVDKVTGKILGYDTDNDGKVDTESADRAWTPTEKTLEAVKSADPSSVGYDKVDIPNVSSLLVTPDQADTTVTVTYSKTTYSLKDEESKTVTRTINYVDSVTGEAIPAELEPSVTQKATLTRSVIYDNKGNKIGYGTVSEDGSSYTLDDSWKVADQTWTKQDSADLSDYGYTAPDKATVEAETVDGSTTDTTVTVYYGHQTVPVTPENPGTPGKPINPKGNVDYPDGVSKDDLTSTVTRTINYVDEDGKAVNGSPDGTSSYVQKAEFTRTAIVDKVTGKILGYDTDNDGKVDTESKDRAWTPTEKTLAAVKSADPSSVGYDKVDKSTVESLLVTPGQADTTVTVTYSNKQVSGTIKYIDVTTGVELDSDTLPTGKVSSKINYKTKDKIKSYENQGYELVSNDFTDGSQVYEKEGNNFVVKLKHKTQTITPNDPNPVTPGEPINPDDPNSPVYGEETNRKNLVKDASQTIHYVGAGDNTPADNVVTQKDAFTRTVTIDKVTGKVLSYTDWTGEKTFNTVGTPVVEGYHADKKVAGGLTATVDNPDVEETVTYAPNGKLVPVDPKGTPIPGADTPTYPTDPNDPTKVVPNEPIPDVPNYIPVDPSTVTPKDPGKDTPVPYTKDETPAAKYGLTEKFVDVDGNELSPSVSKGTDYKTGDKYDVTKDAKVITGYVLVKTTDTTGTFEKSDKTAVFTYKKLGKIVPVDPKGTPIPGTDTPTYKNDPDDPSKVVPNEPTPKVPGYKTDVPKVTPEDPTKDTPVPYTKNETPAAKYGLTEKFVDEDGNELLPSVNKGTDYKTGDKYDVTK
ncbi:mucin-binding protein, partial [Lactobacillus equicursoris]|uniref:mucin-binding protein n=1 Tax=Lactobacillus equicursoris TaxID=420645 RepID=UPI0012DF855A